MFTASATPGGVNVVTSSGGGHSPEQLAELCVARLLHVSDAAPPEIAAQARAFREEMLAVVLRYVRMAAHEERATIVATLHRGGYDRLAAQIRSL